MLRQTITRSLRSSSNISTRSFSVAVARMAEGDLGGTRRGGVQSGDAFTKREGAEEAMYVRQKEREKLIQLKKKLEDQRKHIDALDKHLDELTKEAGGEQN